jgi:NADPH-dependent 7-cyano-7-deazaguanine reductase QueF
MSEIQKEYEESLEKYLKERFLKSFTTILSEETNKMLEAFYKEKERLVAELDKLFSEVIDKDLNEVNRNINKTVDSIRNYYSYLKTFSISDKIENFFRFYANTTLVTLIETFRYDLDNLTFAAIIEDINKKSKIIENIKVTDFLNQIRGLKKYFELNYYNPIKIAYNEYNTPSYRENLLDKMRGILDGLTLRNLVEGEEEEIERKRQESKDVEETFDEIKQLVEIALKYSKACFECDYLTNTAAYYNSKSNMEYKKIKNWITSNKYRKNIHNFLTNKLYKLYYNILSIYYSYVKSGVSEFRIHMKTNINVIYLVNNNTMYTTADTLNDEYKKILDSAKEFEVSYANNKGRNELYEYVHKTEHMINKASATFTGIKEYSEFKYDTDLIGGLFKTPYVKARIVDKSRPDKLLLNVRNEYGFCARTSFRYNVNFTDANYTLTLDYNTKTNNINITTYTNFDKYYYSSQMYQIPEKFEMESITYFGYTVYFIKQCYSKALRNLSDIYINEVPAKNYSETMIIVG